jgi:hypothetical protein
MPNRMLPPFDLSSFGNASPPPVASQGFCARFCLVDSVNCSYIAGQNMFILVCMPTPFDDFYQHNREVFDRNQQAHRHAPAAQILNGERSPEQRRSIRWLYHRNAVSAVVLAGLTFGFATAFYTGMYQKLRSGVEIFVLRYTYNLEHGADISEPSESPPRLEAVSTNPPSRK